MTQASNFKIDGVQIEKKMK